ncbi:MAG: flagellar assembly protein FliH [Gammaproteobacteria bacterium]|nr:flagellar assembly protein FliH [Gammaproteobacteria bacterium]
MTSSKVISSDGLMDVKQWSPPNMDEMETEFEAPEVVETEAPVLTADQLEQIQKAAYDEGFEQGRKEGFELGRTDGFEQGKTEGIEYGHKEALNQGRSELQGRVARLDRLMELLDRPLRQMDDQVEHELIEMVISMVRQLVRREVRTDPEQIIGVMREALSILPVSSRGIRVVLHPEDAEVVRKIYELSERELGWRIIEDPVLARGGCRVVTESSQIDATLESRLATLIAPLLGDERDQS